MQQFITKKIYFHNVIFEEIWHPPSLTTGSFSGSCTVLDFGNVSNRCRFTGWDWGLSAGGFRFGVTLGGGFGTENFVGIAFQTSLFLLVT